MLQMAFSSMWVLTTAFVLLIGLVIYVVIGKQRRELVLGRLNHYRRKASSISTFHLSSSVKEKNSGVANSDALFPKSALPVYVDTFPPSRRSVLNDVLQLIPKVSGKENTTPPSLINGGSVAAATMPEHVNDKVACTPTGFSINDIHSLGDFPPYDVLSGVPLPTAYLNFDLAKALPRPYRPFRWSYHQTMSLTKLEPDWWLELENSYVSRIRQRKELLQKHGSDVLAYLPGSHIACKELMEMCLQFYCARYPSLFSISEDKKIFINNILNTTTNIKTEHPLHVLFNNIPEDFVVMLRNDDDGLYYFRAGIICSSLGWNLGSKLGMPLGEIHQHIPDYKDKMAFSMDRYFSKMPTNLPIQRGSWGFEVGEPLYMAPGDPNEKTRKLQNPDLKIEDCTLRVDWQTLRRLPLSGAMVFNFKALFTPIQEFRDEPYIPSLVLKILTEAKEALLTYKGTFHVEHVILPALKNFEEEQYESGLITGERGNRWVVETLNESPFFPRWEEKWHRQQGF